MADNDFEVQSQNTQPVDTTANNKKIIYTASGNPVDISDLGQSIVMSKDSKQSEFATSANVVQKSYDEIVKENYELQKAYEVKAVDEEYEGIWETTSKFSDRIVNNFFAAGWDMIAGLDVGDWRLPDYLGGQYVNNVFKFVDNTIGDGENEFGNWFSRRADQLREEADVLYKVNTGFDNLDYLLNHTSSFIGMAGGYAIPGLGQAKLLGSVLNLPKAVNVLAGALTMTNAVGMTLATSVQSEVYEKSLLSYDPSLASLKESKGNEAYTKAIDAGLSLEEAEYEKLKAGRKAIEDFAKENPHFAIKAKENAAKGAEYAIKTNFLPSMLLNITTAGLFARGHYFSRDLLKNANRVSLGKVGSEMLQEVAEEVVIEGVAEDAGKVVGLQNREYNFLSDSWKKILTWESLETGIWAAAFGGTMTAGTEYYQSFQKQEEYGGRTKKERYEQQQENIKKWNELSNSNLIEKNTSLALNYAEATKLAKLQEKLVNEGKHEEAKLIGNRILGVQINEAFESGTGEQLRESYLRMSTDTTLKEDIRQRAEEAVKIIDKLEPEYNKTRSKYLNHSDVFANRVTEVSLEIQEKQLNDAIIEKKAEATIAIGNAIARGDIDLNVGKIKKTKTVNEKDETGRLVKEIVTEEDTDIDYDIENLGVNPYDKTAEPKLHEKYETFANHIANNLTSVQELTELQDLRNQTRSLRLEADKQYNELTSKEKQKSLVYQNRLLLDYQKSKDKLENLKGTDEYEKEVKTMLEPYKNKILKKDLENLEKALLVENEIAKVVKKTAVSETIAKKHGNEKPEAKNRNEVSLDENRLESSVAVPIATKIAQEGSESLTPDEKDIYEKNKTQINNEVNKIRKASKKTVSKTVPEEITEEFDEENNPGGNDERKDILNEINQVIVTEEVPTEVKPAQPVSQQKTESTSVEQQKAEIERRRQEELELRNSIIPQVTGSKSYRESITDPNSINKNVWESEKAAEEAMWKEMQEVSDWIDSMVENNIPTQKIIDKVGRLIGVQGKASWMLLANERERLYRFIKAKSEGKIKESFIDIIKSSREEINAKYDAEYIDAVKKGIMTREQAMQALKEVGRKDNKAYAELAALESQQETTQQETIDSLIANETDSKRKTILEKLQKGISPKVIAAQIKDVKLVNEVVNELKSYNLIDNEGKIISTPTNNEQNQSQQTNLAASNLMSILNDGELFGVKIAYSIGPDGVSKVVKFDKKVIGEEAFNKLLEIAKQLKEKGLPNVSVSVREKSGTISILKQDNNSISLDPVEVESLEPAEVDKNFDKSKTSQIKQLVENFYEALSLELNGEPTFEDFIKDAIRNSSREQVYKNFNYLKLGWEANGYLIPDSYSDIINKLLLNKKQILTDIFNIADVKTDEVVTGASEEEIKEFENDNKNKSVGNKTAIEITPEAKQKTYEVEVLHVATTESRVKLGYAIRFPKQVVTQEEDKKIISYEYDESADPKRKVVKSQKLLDFNKYGAGTELTIEIPPVEILFKLLMPLRDENGNIIYKDGKRQTITFKEWFENKKQQDPSFDENSEEYIMNVPMFFKDADGDYVANLHDEVWFDDANYAGSDKKEAINNVRAVRLAVVSSIKAGKAYSVEITENSGGTWDTLKQEELIPVSEADPQSMVGLYNQATDTVLIDGKPTKLNILDNSTNSKAFSNNNSILSIRRWGKDENGNPTYRALPMFFNPVTDAEKNSIYMGILTYLINNNSEIDESLKTKHKRISDTVESQTKYETVTRGSKKQQSINLFTPQGLINFIKDFTLVDEFNLKGENVKVTEEDILNEINGKKWPDGKSYMYLTNNGSTIAFGIKGELDTTFINITDLNNGFTPEINKKLEDLKTTISKIQYRNYNIKKPTGPVTHIDTDGNVTQVATSYQEYIKANSKTNIKSVNIGTEEEPLYTIKTQSNIYTQAKSAPISPSQVDKKESTNKDVQKVLNTLETYNDDELFEAIEESKEDGFNWVGKTKEIVLEEFKSWSSNPENLSEVSEFTKEYLESKTEKLKEVSETKTEGEVTQETISNEEQLKAIKEAEALTKWANEYFENNDDVNESLDPVEISNEEAKEIAKKINKVSGIENHHINEIIDFLFNSVSDKFTTEGDASVNMNELSNEIKEKLNEQLSQNKELITESIEKLKLLPQTKKVQELINRHELALSKIDTILSNENILVEETFNKLKKYLGLKQVENKLEANDELVSSDNDETDDEQNLEEEVNDQDHIYSKSSLEEDGKKSITGKLRIFMSGIPDVNSKTNQPNSGVMGVTKFIDFDTAFNTIQGLLADSPMDFQTMLQILEIYKDTHPWLPTFIKKLNDADSQLKNQFVVAMGKHALKMEFVIYSFGKNGAYSLKVMDTNSSASISKINKQWSNNFIANSILSDVENGEYVLNKEAAELVYERYQSWGLESILPKLSQQINNSVISIIDSELKKPNPKNEIVISKTDARYKNISKITAKGGNMVSIKGRDYKVSFNKETNTLSYSLLETSPVFKAITDIRNISNEDLELAITEIQEWFLAFGIDLEKNAIDYMLKNGVKDTAGKTIKGETIFKESETSGAPIGFLANWLKKSINSKNDINLSDIEDNADQNPMKNNAINRTLSTLQSLFSPSIVTNSFRDGKKSIYGFTAFKYVTDKFNELKSDEALLDTIMNTPFGSTSLWLQFMKDEKFRSKISISHLGLTALSEIGKKTYQDMNLHSLSDSDHELLKVGLFQDKKQGGIDKNENINGITLRVARMLFPTMSDKTTSIIVKSPVLDLISSSKEAFKRNQDGTYSLTNNVLEILVEQTILPEIKRIIDFNLRGKQTNIKGYEKGAIKILSMPSFNDLKLDVDGEEITLNSLLNSKEFINTEKSLDDHVDEILNFYGATINEEMNKIINQVVQDKVANWKSNNFVDEKGNIKFFDSTYMLPLKSLSVDDQLLIAAFDFEVNQIIGNANAFTSIAGDPAIYYKSDSNSFEEQSKDTAINIGKRLAAMIAPGSKLADSENEQYTQVAINDRKSIAENIEMLVSFYDPSVSFNKKELNEIINLPENTLEEKRAKKEKLSDFINKYPNTKPYFEIESTDAQEYTTWQEHLHILEKMGRISETVANITPEEIREAKELFANNVPLKDMTAAQKEIVKKVMQPIKPVYTGQVYDPNNNTMRMVYIKSSSFPLIPQLTEGKEIDKLRLTLQKLQEENPKKQFVRASYQSANKVGAPTEAITIWDGEGNYVEPSSEKINKASLTLNRKDFKIQLDVPFKSYKRKDDTISLGTQLNKLLFGNGIMDIEERIFNVNGKPYNGKELEKLYTDTFIELFNLRKQKIYDELGIDIKTNNPFNVKETALKLQTLLKEEATNRGFSKQDIEGLELEYVYDGNNLISSFKFKLPLWLSANSNKYENLLNAIISNRIVKVKMPGNSYVAGSQEGFKISTSINDVKNKDKVVYTSKWTGELLPAMYDEEGNLQYAQVLAPSKFKNKDGKLIDLFELDENKKYKYLDTTPTGYRLKTNMIDPELLGMTSFRIPTSAHMSGSFIEIVGFIPNESGDLMIVPKNFTKQKGLDFDVDKENAYQYWHVVDEETGKIKKLSKNDDVSNINEKLLQNTIIDVHNSIFSNNDKRIQKKINKVLSIDYASEQASKIDEMISDSQDKKFTFLSSEYQKSKVALGASGKVGTGAYSLDVTSHSLFEQAKAKGNGLSLQIDEGVDFSMTFDGFSSNGKLGEEKTLDESRTISEVLAELQNIAVDNEKEQVMGRVNLNSFTLDVSKVMAMLGFDKGIDGDSIQFLFLSQPIIKDYVKEMANINGITSGFIKDKQGEVIKKLLTKYGITEDQKKVYFDGHDSDSSNEERFTNKEFIKNIKSKPENVDNLFQAMVLNRFLILDNYGKSIRNIQTAINVDSKGLGKAIIENQEKLQTIANLSKNTKIKNASKLIGDYVVLEEISNESVNGLLKQGYVRINDNLFIKPTTVSGIVAINALSTATTLWNNHFPYDSYAINGIFNEIIPILSSGELSENKKIEKKQEILKEIKKFMNASAAFNTLIDNVNIQKERERIFVDIKGKKESLASYLQRQIGENPVLKNNKLLQRFGFEINLNNKPSLITYDNAVSGNFDEDAVNNALLELLNRNLKLGDFNGQPYTSRMLAQDLINYALLEGGVQEVRQFSKFIPIKYLEKMGFSFRINNSELNSSKNIFGFNKKGAVSRFTNQFFQHNPKNAPRLENISDNSEKLSKLDSFDSSELSSKPEFISTKIGNNYKLWKLVEDKYVSIPVINTREEKISQYDPDSDIINPIFEKKNQVKESRRAKDAQEIPMEAVPVKDVAETSLNKERFELGNNNLANTLTSIINNPNVSSELKELAKLLLPAINDKTKIKVGNPTKNNFNGKFNSENNEITIGYSWASDSSVEDLARTILKETVHSITDNEVLTYLDIDGNILPGLENKEVPSHIFALSKLFKEAKSKIPAETIARIKSKIKNKQELESQEKRVGYGVTNIKEFIEMIMTQPEFQEEMNKHKLGESDKTLLNKFYEIIANLINSVASKITNVELKQGKITAEAIGSIIKLIDEKSKLKQPSTQPTETPIAQDSETIYSQLGNKTQSSNIVISNIKTKDGKYDRTANIKEAKDKGRVYTMEVDSDVKSFSNPWASFNRTGTIKTNSTKEAVLNYIDWLTTDKFINVKPERRAFILDILKSGKLKGRQLQYYAELKEPSHATALDYLINKYDWSKASTGKVPTTMTLKEYADKTSARFVNTREVLRKDDIEYYNDRVNDLIEGRLKYAIFAPEDLNNRQYLPFINKLKENGFKPVEEMEYVLSKGGVNPKEEYAKLATQPSTQLQAATQPTTTQPSTKVNKISDNIKSFVNSLIPNWIDNKNNELSLVSEFKSIQLLSQEESTIKDRINFGKEAEELIREGVKGKNPFKGVTFESQIPNLLYAVISGKLAESNISEKDMYDNIFSTQPEIKPTTTSNLPGPETKINIYAGTGENAELSNFAARPFNYNGIKFPTVEHAFQYAKGNYYNTYEIDPSSNITPDQLQDKVDKHLKNILNAATGAEAKKLGRKNIGVGFENSFWDTDSSDIMKDLLLKSFKQNPDALAKLLATGNATLTHTQDKGKWGTEFPKLLMEVREELKGQQPTTTQEVKTKPVVNYETEVYNTLKALEDAEFNVNDVSPETIASEDFSKYPKTLEYLNSGYVVDNTQFNLITQNKNEFEKLLNKTKATDLISLLDALTELKNVSSIETKIETKELSDTNQDEKLLEDLDNDEFIDKFSLDPTEEDWTSESNECGI